MGGVMVDTLDQPSRSRVMARVKGKNTGPELLVRKWFLPQDIAIGFTSKTFLVRRI